MLKLAKLDYLNCLRNSHRECANLTEVYIPQMVQVYFPGTIAGLPVFFPDFFPVQPIFYIKDYNF